MVGMAAGNEQGSEGPMELLRELVEESGKWTEELVVFTGQMLFVEVILALFFFYLYSRLFLGYLSGDEAFPFFPAIIGAAIGIYFIYGFFRLRRIYRNRVNRRERWRQKFRILRQKEEEIEKLLSGEGAG